MSNDNETNLWDIPKSWIAVSLSDLGTGENAIVDGPFGSNLKVSDYIDDPVNGVPVLTTRNLQGDYSPESVRFISRAKFEQLRRSQVKPGDILMAKIGSIGKMGVYPQGKPTAIIPANLLKFTVTDRVDFNYVYYCLGYSGFQKFIKNISTATAQPAFNVTKFRRLRIPLPPRNEQRRIVAKIEELFAELDQGVAALERVQAQLRTYRQALLKHAFEGKLTAQWREANQDKLEPAATLLARIEAERKARYAAEVAAWEARGKMGRKPPKLNDLPPLREEELREMPALPDGWKWVKLANLTEVTGGLTKNQKRKALSIKRPFLRVANVYANKLELDEVHEIGVRAEEIARTLLQKDDLLIVEGNGSIEHIGRVAIWDNSVDGCLHQNHLIKARPSKLIRAKFILFFLLSEQGRKFIIQQASSTSGLHTLSLSKVSSLYLPLCSGIEQREIALLLDEYLSNIDGLERTLTTALQQAAVLRQAILKKAFAGQLVPQDPHDEPASTLLARIRAT